MAESSGRVEEGQGRKARARVVLREVGVAGLAHRNTSTQQKDVAFVRERTGLVEGYALQQVRIPFEPC